ncbi:hypothetical protein [Foetidibacter luteolus]|uniref:hypothetical protein n=1 Tax=Foetidibacter luteolus TaxID=2608880 RepID=UPI00129BB4CF|nr:hypothetical protein [Foetidibacter luteolus]
MSIITESARPSFKLFNNRSILAGTFIGGPLVAGYLFSTNYRRLGQRENSFKAWLYSVAFTIIMLCSIAIAPVIGGAGISIPFLQTAIASYLYKRLLVRQVIVHARTGGAIEPVGKAVLAGVVGFCIMLSTTLLLIVHRHS